MPNVQIAYFKDNKLISFAFLFILLIAFPVKSQIQIKIMTYNLLNYPGTDTAVRNPHFRTIINAADPDILIVNEIMSQSGVNSFLSNVMNNGGATYSAGTFINGYDTDNAIFYKSSKIKFINNIPVSTNLRDINEFIICDKLYQDTLRIFAVHLKANASDSLLRSAEVDSLRKRTNQLRENSNFIVLGDFNIYSSNESAYRKLIQNNPDDDGNFTDPLNLTGLWNKSSYAAYHTQSTRTRSFGNGSTGGLDDRFDMILYSNAVKNPGGIKFQQGTYLAFGNDGNHYNDSINKIPNLAVTQTIANALHYASDHIPVLGVFEFGSASNLNVRVIPEGLYKIALNNLARRDSLKVYLRKTISPYDIIDSSGGLIDSVSFNAPVTFRSAKPGNYYVVVKTKNSIETWSRTGINYSASDTVSYDFTVSDTAAFGNNLLLKGNKFCLYSGDIDNDGSIDLADVLYTNNIAFTFLEGYSLTDINGDNITDLADVLVVYNNSNRFVTSMSP